MHERGRDEALELVQMEHRVGVEAHVAEQNPAGLGAGRERGGEIRVEEDEGARRARGRKTPRGVAREGATRKKG